MKIDLHKRVETGVIQFGDDWPGYFFRGDEAAHQAGMLRGAVDAEPHIREKVLEDFAKKLESCWRD
jgi:hypothetical protein